MSTSGGYLEEEQYIGEIMIHVEGYHEYIGRCSVPWRPDWRVS